LKPRSSRLSRFRQAAFIAAFVFLATVHGDLTARI
jgi:hypothetical protein